MSKKNKVLGYFINKETAEIFIKLLKNHSNLIKTKFIF